MTLRQSPKLLERFRQSARARHFSRRTEDAYVSWIRRYVRHHGVRHPEQMGETEVAAFLNHLANESGVSASTQRQAASALTFLYTEVLGRPLDLPRSVARPRRGRRTPVVLAREEVQALFRELDGVHGAHREAPLWLGTATHGGHAATR